MLFQSFQYPLFVQHNRSFSIGADFSSLQKKFNCQFCQFFEFYHLCVSCSALRTQDQSQEQVISKLTTDIEQKRQKKQKTKTKQKQKQTEEQKQTKKPKHTESKNYCSFGILSPLSGSVAQWIDGINLCTTARPKLHQPLLFCPNVQPVPTGRILAELRPVPAGVPAPATEHRFLRRGAAAAGAFPGPANWIPATVPGPVCPAAGGAQPTARIPAAADGLRAAPGAKNRLLGGSCRCPGELRHQNPKHALIVQDRKSVV